MPDPVQQYLDGVADPRRRAALEHLRDVVLAAAPDAEPVTSYRLPAWWVPARGAAGPEPWASGATGGEPVPDEVAPGGVAPGGVVCGFAVTRAGWSYYPFSGSVVTALAERLAGWRTTKGSIHVPVARPLPDDLVADMVALRRREIAARGL